MSARTNTGPACVARQAGEPDHCSVRRSACLPIDARESQYNVFPARRAAYQLPLTATVDYVTGSPWASGGTYGYDAGVISWTGTLSANQTVSLAFEVRVADDLTGPLAVRNVALLDDRVGVLRTVEAMALVNPRQIYLPVVLLTSHRP